MLSPHSMTANVAALYRTLIVADDRLFDGLAEIVMGAAQLNVHGACCCGFAPCTVGALVVGVVTLDDAPRIFAVLHADSSK